MKKFVLLMLALLSCILGTRAENPEEINLKDYLVRYYDKVDSTKIAVIYRDDVVREKVSMHGYGTLKGSFEDYGYGNKYLFIGVDKDKYEKVNNHLKEELEGYATLTKVFLPEHYEFYHHVQYFLRPYIEVNVKNEEEYALVEKTCYDYGLTLYEHGVFVYPCLKSRSESDEGDDEYNWGEFYNMAIDPARGIDPLDIMFALVDIAGFPSVWIDDGDYDLGLENCLKNSVGNVEIRAGVVHSPQQVRVTGVSGVSFDARAGFDLNTLCPGVYIISAPGCKPVKFPVR